MKILIASVFALILLAGPARAGEDPDEDGDGTGGAFSPKFDNSPVTIVLCLTEDACPVRPPK